MVRRQAGYEPSPLRLGRLQLEIVLACELEGCFDGLGPWESCQLSYDGVMDDKLDGIPELTTNTFDILPPVESTRN